MNASAAANGITVTAAYYTDICGVPLQLDGTAALDASNAYNLAVAAQVGSGMPASGNTTPNCPSHVAGPPAGVLVYGQKNVRTYLANVVGTTTITVTTASGYLQESCAASQGDSCALLPVTVPVDIVSCSKSNKPTFPGGQYVADGVTVYKIPLCSNDPGNVGWLDWTPPGGGTSKLIQSIQTPNNPASRCRPDSTPHRPAT